MDKRIIIALTAAILAAAGIVLFGVFYGVPDHETTAGSERAARSGETESYVEIESGTESETDAVSTTESYSETTVETETEAKTEKPDESTVPEEAKTPASQDDANVKRAKRERGSALIKLRADLMKFDFEQIVEALRAHTKEYPDTRGWIYVPDTEISFPIVQGTDNDFYLDHNAEGGYYVCGSIFADYRNSKNIWRDFNTVVYGHNVWFGGMFHDIERFLSEDFFTTHNIYIFTLDALFVYQPFSIYMADWGYKYFHPYIQEGDDWVSFAREMRDNSKFPQDVDFTRDDHIFTVSTCTNGKQTERWSFQSKRTAEIDYKSVKKLVPHFPHNYRDLYSSDNSAG